MFLLQLESSFFLWYQTHYKCMYFIHHKVDKTIAKKCVMLFNFNWHLQLQMFLRFALAFGNKRDNVSTMTQIKLKRLNFLQNSKTSLFPFVYTPHTLHMLHTHSLSLSPFQSNTIALTYTHLFVIVLELKFKLIRNIGLCAKQQQELLNGCFVRRATMSFQKNVLLQ